MSPNKTTARIAGLLYLIVVVTGFFHLIYVPSQINVQGDAAATMNNILASRQLFGLGIGAGVVCYTAFLLLPLVLYRLLGHVGREIAVAMVALALVSVPISLVSLAHRLDVLSLLGGAAHLQAFTPEQLRALAMQSLDAYRNGMRSSEVFWGLWLLPFGSLVFSCGFLPRILGVFLMLGCLGYLVNILAPALFPDYAKSGIEGFVSLPSAIGEIGTCLWLLIVGVREPKIAAAPARDGA